MRLGACRGLVTALVVAAMTGSVHPGERVAPSTPPGAARDVQHEAWPWNDGTRSWSYGPDEPIDGPEIYARNSGIGSVRDSRVTPGQAVILSLCRLPHSVPPVIPSLPHVGPVPRDVACSVLTRDMGERGLRE